MTQSESNLTLKPGDTLGGYQLLALVGTGGMGRVWAAKRADAPAQSLVALKTAIEELAGDEQFERMLLDEARIAASIIHPNVCAISEVGAEKGLPYLVMDWMDAGTLLDLLTALPSHRLDYFLAARIFADVASGLHAAHELTGSDGCPLNVVHRDVSPQNVLLSSAGHVKVADFGVAKARGQLHAPTVTGELKGKLSYMAPEQLTSKIIDRRADVFALGCCLYEATTGTRPYHGADALETMYKLLESECAPPSQLQGDYPSILESIVLKALEKNPERRYQTADEMRVALAGFLAKHEMLITDREISAVVRTALSGPIEKRAHAIEEASRTVSRIKAEPAKPAINPLGQDRSGNTPQPWNTPHSHRRRLRSAGWISFVGAALAVVVLFAVFRRSAPEALVTPRTTATSNTAQPSVPQITVTLRSEPPNAVIRIDNGPALTSPQVVVTGKSDELHGILVTLDGYEPLSRQIAFDRSQEVVLGLKPLEGESRGEPKPSTRPKRSATVTRGTPVAPASSVPLDLQAPRKRRPKRPIDSSNPFADPQP